MKLSTLLVTFALTAFSAAGHAAGSLPNPSNLDGGHSAQQSLQRMIAVQKAQNRQQQATQVRAARPQDRAATRPGSIQHTTRPLSASTRHR